MKTQVNKISRYIKNNKGVSIIEVLVAAGLMAIVSVGVMTMMQNSMTEQKKQQLMASLSENKKKMENLIRDQVAWNNTVNSSTNNAAAPFIALRASTTVAEIAGTAAAKIVLMDGANNVAYNLLALGATTGNGFTETGAACTTFNAAAGSGTDACPLSYRLVVAADCTTGATCTNPQLKIVARLLFNPSTTGILNKFKNIIAQVNSSDISDAVMDGKYDVSVKRTSSQVNRVLTISSSHTGSSVTPYLLVAGGETSYCNNRGAGICTTSYAVHPLLATSPWVADENADGLISFAAPAGGANFKFTETGIYACIISVPAFATSGFRAQLWKTSGTPAAVTGATGSTISGRWSQSVAIIDAKFNVSSLTDTYSIYQQCDTIPTVTGSGDASIARCSLGMVPISAYTGGVKIISMTCNKLDRAN